MDLQENSSQINISSAPEKKSLHPLRYLFFNSLLLIAALVVSYTFVEITVLSILMDYLTDSSGVNYLNQREAAVVTNLQDSLSSIFCVIVSLISEAYTGSFTMITFCTAASIEGLMLLWLSNYLNSDSAFDAVYAAIVFLALGNSGQRLSKKFLEYQVQERVKTRKDREVEHGSTQNEKKQDCMDKSLTNFWSLAPLVVAYIITICMAYIFGNVTYEELFRFAALLMGATNVLFLFGCMRYSREKLPDESSLKKILRIFKAALGRRKLKYPTSPNCYYWKDYTQNHFYEQGGGVRLLPRVPWPFRWLDKAAIVKEEVSPETQEKNGELFTVKEVREVKSLVPMMFLSFTFYGYSFLLTSGNIFFVAQASSMRSVITANIGRDISILFLIKLGASDMSRFICFIIRFIIGQRASDMSRFICFIIRFIIGQRNFKVIDSMSNKEKAAAILRIGIGMLCAAGCSLKAWDAEVRRLKLVNKEGEQGHPRGNSTVTLIPQFLLLGMTEGFINGGFERLIQGHVAESMWSLAVLFNEFVNGMGKLLVMPFVFSGWIQETVDTSHLYRFYLLLAIFNFVLLLLPFTYYSYTYAYKEECPEDEEEQPFYSCRDSEDSDQENNDDAQQQVDLGILIEEPSEGEDENIVSIWMILEFIRWQLNI